MLFWANMGGLTLWTNLYIAQLSQINRSFPKFRSMVLKSHVVDINRASKFVAPGLPWMDPLELRLVIAFVRLGAAFGNFNRLYVLLPRIW